MYHRDKISASSVPGHIPCVSSLTVPIQVYYESTSYITTLVTETPSSDYNAQSLRIMQLSSIPNSRFTMWSQRQMLLHIIHIYELTHLEVHSIAWAQPYLLIFLAISINIRLNFQLLVKPSRIPGAERPTTAVPPGPVHLQPTFSYFNLITPTFEGLSVNVFDPSSILADGASADKWR